MLTPEQIKFENEKVVCATFRAYCIINNLDPSKEESSDLFGVKFSKLMVMFHDMNQELFSLLKEKKP